MVCFESAFHIVYTAFWRILTFWLIINEILNKMQCECKFEYNYEYELKHKYIDNTETIVTAILITYGKTTRFVTFSRNFHCSELNLQLPFFLPSSLSDFLSLAGQYVFTIFESIPEPRQ